MTARVLWVLVVTGCWTEEPLIDGLFTTTEWDQLQLMRFDQLEPDYCPGMSQSQCDAAANLGQQLFFRNEFAEVVAVAKQNGAARDPQLRQRLARSWMGL